MSGTQDRRSVFPGSVRPILYIAIGSLALSVSCNQERTAQVVTTPVAAAAAADTASKPVAESRIVIHLRGVIALLNPTPSEHAVVHALIPKDRVAQQARDNRRVRIPAHFPFIRFPIKES